MAQPQFVLIVVGVLLLLVRDSISIGQSGPIVEPCVRIYQFYHSREGWPILESDPRYVPVHLAGPVRNVSDLIAAQFFPPLRDKLQQQQLGEAGGILAVYRYLIEQPKVCKYIGFSSQFERSLPHDYHTFNFRPLAQIEGFLDSLANGTVGFDAESDSRLRKEGRAPELSFISWLGQHHIDLVEQAVGHGDQLMKTWHAANAELLRPVFDKRVKPWPTPSFPQYVHSAWRFYWMMDFAKLRGFVLYLESHASVFHRQHRFTYLTHLDPYLIPDDWRRPPIEEAQCPFRTGEWPASICYRFIAERLVLGYLWLSKIDSAWYINNEGKLGSVWEYYRPGQLDAMRATFPRLSESAVEFAYRYQVEQHDMYPFGSLPGYSPLLSPSPPIIEVPSNSALIAKQQAATISSAHWVIFVAGWVVLLYVVYLYTFRRLRRHRGVKTI